MLLSIVFRALEWNAQEVSALIPASSVKEHHASVAPRHREFAAQDLQESLVSDFGWPEGTDDTRAGDGASTLAVTAEMSLTGELRGKLDVFMSNDRLEWEVE